MLTHRRVTAADEGFLRHLDASTHADEMAALPLSDAQKAAFLDMQFRARQAGYRTQCPEAEDWLLLEDERPVGRLCVDRRTVEIHIVDIALLPECRGRGLGTALLSELHSGAAEAGLPLRLHVAAASPARRLYERLGFVAVRQEGLHLLMESVPRD
jgi:ribosomal protein S18 acetylase RimI-like enzyme